MKVNLIENLPPEAMVVKSAIISFNNSKPLQFYYNFKENCLTNAGQKLVKNMLEHKHKSVFFQPKIELTLNYNASPSFKDPLISKEILAGCQLDFENKKTRATLSLYSALCLYSIFTKVTYQIGRDIGEVLARKTPFVLKCWQELNHYFFKPNEIQLIKEASLTNLSFEIEAPMFVMSQLKRHNIDISFNEVSRRYVKSKPKVWIAVNWREQDENKKQCSTNKAIEEISNKKLQYYEDIIDSALCWYERNTNNKMCSEQARAILPTATYTIIVLTGTVWALSRLCSLRLKKDTQAETREVAKKIYNICKHNCPKFDTLIELRDKSYF